ncbi:Hypothetical protein PFR_JS2_1849 [Propionibacterium freudenreichii]|nr:Hypothetical protein PFR_JS2_1849 [Propionibacterium freudenreichii]
MASPHGVTVLQAAASMKGPSRRRGNQDGLREWLGADQPQ